MMQAAQMPDPRQVVAMLQRKRSVPRNFLLTWDNSKTKTRDSRKQDKHEAFGTCYPNGLVTLDNGTVFTMLSELHHLMDLKGSYDLAWLDEE